MSLIRADNLSKSFLIHQKQPGLLASARALFTRNWVEKHALKGVTFGVEEGEIMGLVGANGAGKTTLVKILSGIVKASGGSASVLGLNPWDRSKAFRKSISLVMGQKAQLWWDLPAADGFLLLKEIYEIPTGQFRETLEYLTETLAVSELLTTQVRRLSLGERMKMEIIAALLHRPRVIFLDEPTIGLDMSTQRILRRFLREYQQRYRASMILTSHYMEDIKSLSDRLLIIRNGELVYQGDPLTLASEFGVRRTIRAHFDSTPPGDLLPTFISRLADTCEASVEGETLTIVAPGHEVKRLIAALFELFSLRDVTVEEEDISLVIERLMGGGGHAH
jgi:ABC-2 type transport system ATP-binding protein